MSVPTKKKCRSDKEAHFPVPWINDPQVEGSGIGDAGDVLQGESVPIFIGKRFVPRGIWRRNVHPQYHAKLGSENYKGERYVIDTNYQDPQRRHPLRVNGRPTYGAPDGRTRRIIRDLKSYTQLRNESGRRKIIEQMRRYVQLHKQEYGRVPEKIIIDWW